MTVKRFVAPDMRRALDLVRQEMGPDAIILSSQRTKNGVEIITSVETDLPTRGADVRREFGERFDEDFDRPLPSDQAWGAQQGIQEAADRYRSAASVQQNIPSADRASQLAREIEAARERMLAAKGQAKVRDRYESPSQEPVGAKRPVAAPSKKSPTQPRNSHQDYQVNQQMAGLAEQVKSKVASVPNTADGKRFTALQNEIADMRILLEQQMWRMREQPNEMALNAPRRSLAVEALDNHLSRLGLPKALVKKLSVCATPGKHLNAAWREALAHLSRRLPTDNTDCIAKGGIFAFVGPTGVGKTTTIAKLAARHVLAHGLGQVALITTDTYRVGAHDQLRALGRILNVPVRVVDKERNLSSVVASLKNFPVILIDTAGFRQGDPLLKEQTAMLNSCLGVQRILVLACNSQVQTLKASAHAHREDKLRGCVLTKLDETASLGEALGVVIQQKLPVLYTSDGQAVPKDITVATGHKLVARAVAVMKRQQVEAESAVHN